MPRIDNSDDTVIQIYKLGHPPPVIDLCDDCHCSWLDADLEIKHPPYSNGIYHCFECGRRLTDSDNDERMDTWVT